MVEVRRLDPHDPLPEGRRNVVVMHRLDEDDPRHTHTEIVLTGTPGETVRPMRPDGKPMSLDEAIKAAQDVRDRQDFWRPGARGAVPRWRPYGEHGLPV